MLLVLLMVDIYQPLVDAGAGTAAHRSADNSPCVTISLDLKFIGASKIGDEIIGHVKF